MIPPMAAAVAGAAAVQRAVALQGALVDAATETAASLPVPATRQKAPETPGDAVAIQATNGLILADVDRDQVGVDEETGEILLETTEVLMSPHPVDLEEVR